MLLALALLDWESGWSRWTECAKQLILTVPYQISEGCVKDTCDIQPILMTHGFCIYEFIYSLRPFLNPRATGVTQRAHLQWRPCCKTMLHHHVSAFFFMVCLFMSDIFHIFALLLVVPLATMAPSVVLKGRPALSSTRKL